MCSSPHWQVGSSWFREKLSPANRNKGYRDEQISRKIVSRELNAKSYRDFAKNIALLGATSAKFVKSVGKKMGSNMRPRYIQFRDIHDRVISGLHCIRFWNKTNLRVICLFTARAVDSEWTHMWPATCNNNDGRTDYLRRSHLTALPAGVNNHLRCIHKGLAAF